MISKCKCKHQYQDKQYGEGMRVFNQGQKEAKCTACGTSKKEIK